MLAILVGSSAVAGFHKPDAFAQNSIAIKTSADNHDLSFFGHALVQVIVYDGDADDAQGEEISVRIDASGELGDSIVFDVPDTNPGSGRFEFFLVHADSIYNLDELDPTNSDLAVGMTGAGPRAAPIITFGPAGQLATGEGLFEDVDFDIIYSDRKVSVQYQSTDGDLSLDRTEYGSDSFVYLRIADQDANLDPTGIDEFAVAQADMDLLFTLSGGSFEDDIEFRETKMNSAVFEARIKLTKDVSSEPPSPDFIEWDSRSVSLTLHDKNNYDEDVDNDGSADIEMDDAVNDSAATSSLDFSIEDDDGQIELLNPPTFSNELKLSLTDNDQNRDSELDETLPDAVTVSVDSGDSVTFSLKETDDNSGIFEIDLANNELEITFCTDGPAVCPDATNTVLELREQDVDENIVITYSDLLSDSASPEDFDFETKLDTTRGTLSFFPIPGVIDEIRIRIADPDLNDNVRIKEYYSFTLLGTEPVSLKKNGNPIGDFAKIEAQIEGITPNYRGIRTFTFEETGVNTGEFDVVVDADDYFATSGLIDPLGDGEVVEVTYHDEMELPDQESEIRFRLLKLLTSVNFSRTVSPIPATDLDNDGSPDPVRVKLIITDWKNNRDPTIENKIPFLNADPRFDDETLFFKITLQRANGQEVLLLDPNTNNLAGIFAITPEPLRETGINTGVFTTDFVLQMGGEFDEVDDWQDSKLFVEFIEEGRIRDDDRNEKAGLRFSGYSGSLTADRADLAVGDILTLAVDDSDLNLDDEVADEFSTSDGFLVTAETKNDSLDSAISAKIFRETGPDTGVFVAEYKIGSDIPVTEIEDGRVRHASRVVFSYDDRLDGNGSSGDEVELSLPVLSESSQILVTPDKVGPGTKLTVQIIDNDLNLDAASTDDYDSSNMVEFRSDRKQAGQANPDLKETGPNTGMFEFHVQLRPEEDGDNGDFGVARGGNEPAITVLPGDVLSIRYEDERDISGQPAVISRVISIASWDPQFEADKESYIATDRIRLTIYDPDANGNPDFADSLAEIKVFSKSDAAGKEISALETGRDTGVFVLEFSVSDKSGDGAVFVSTNDFLTVQYKDEFPADYASRLKAVSKPEKTFTHTIMIGDNMPARVTPPVIARNENLEAGAQLVISTGITNNISEPQSFVAIIEVLDSAGFTRYLQWQSGMLEASGSADIGLSWQPDAPGSYMLRAFLISDLLNPEPLSFIQESAVEIQ
jgi:hypothetical protein